MIKYATMTLNAAYEKVIETYLAELKNLYDTYYPLLTEENIKNTVSSLYQKYTLELKSIIASTKTEYEEKAKEILNEFKADAYEYVKNKIDLTIDEYKELILSEINVLYEKANILITDADIKEYLDKYYELQKQAVEKLSTIDDCKNMLEDVISSSKDIVKEISIKYLADAKLALKTKIDELVNEALKKIDNEEIKTNINSFYQEEVSKIDKINDVDDLKTKSNEILKDTENKIKEFVLAQVTIYKNKAIEFLDENIKSLIDKITDEEIKTKVTNFYNTEKAKIENINDIDSAKEIGTTIANDTQEFLKDISGDLIDIGKSYAKVELKKLVDQALEYITDEDLKKELNDFYTQEIEKIDKIDSKEKVESTTTEVLNDTKEKIEDIVKRYLVKIKADLKTKLDNLVNSALLNITDEDLRKEINDFYTQEIEKINKIEKLEEIKTTSEEILNDTKKFIEEETKKQIKIFKDAALKVLDEKINSLISTIEDETVKTKVTNFYSTEKAKIENINDIDSAKEIGATVLKDSEDFIKEVGAELLKTLKKNAKDNLDKIVNEGLTKLPSESLKQSLNTYYQTEIQKIDAINSIDGASDTIDEVTNDTKLYIKELVASTLADAKKLMKEYLDKVVSASKVSPYSFIPESMKPGYSNNLVTASDVTYDFSNFVNVSSIKYGGFGEQWNMVIDNITQSEKMNSVLTKGETVLNTSVTLFKEYLDNKYSDSLEYEITKEGFTALINFEDGILSYTLTYTTGLSIPLFGEVTPIVSMYLDSSTNIKYITIKLTETNVLKYTVTDNSYKFEMNYGVDQASRTAYLNIEKDSNNKVTGKIYEFITVAGKTISNSCADFYIDNEYVTAVGNKADGIVGLDGYINELYKVSDGKLLGYKIRETKTVAKISGTYHTLWFNLSDISGITSIKVLDHDKGNSSNSNDIYINGSDKVFTPTYNKKYGVSTSRKYDIELRTQYFYSYDEVNKEYISHEVQIPMMFIQDDNDTDTNYKDYSSNILSANSITSEVKLSSTYLEKIRDDYSTLIDIFITNKETITADTIKEDLGITKTE